MSAIKPGDEVRIFDVNGKRVGQPDGGWEGTVIKVGRSLAHITYRGRTEAFRLDGGHRNDAYGHQYFLTPGEVAERARKTDAIEALRRRRIMIDFGHRLTLEQIEQLAEVVRSWDAPGRADAEREADR